MPDQQQQNTSGMLTGNNAGDTLLTVGTPPQSPNPDPIGGIIPSTQESAMEEVDDEIDEGQLEPQQNAGALDYRTEYEKAEKRRRDLQSYHDKVRTDLENKLKGYGAIDVNEYNDLKVLKAALVNNPDLLDVVQARITGGNHQATTTQFPAQSRQVAPQHNLQLPPQPLNFDPYDQFNLATESGRWYAEVRRIEQDALAERLAETVTTKLTKSQQQQIQQEEARRQTQQGQQELDTFLQTVDDPAARDEFLHFIADGPESIGLPKKPTVDVLFSLYQMLKANAATAQAQAQQNLTAKFDTKIKQSQAVPNVNLSRISGEDTNVPLTEADSFFSGLKTYSKGIQII